MANLTGTERSRYVNHTFTRIARRYELMNHLMTGGMDIQIRKKVIRKATLLDGARLLDIGTGTGDLTREALKQHPGVDVTAADFTFEMLQSGADWGTAQVLNADALHLPFPDETFDTIISGYLLRNVGNLETALQEQYRVLKPGGQIITLDTTRPRKHLLTPLITLHLKYIIPWLGKILTGEKEAYLYLPDSTFHFVTAETLAEKLKQCGFTNVTFEILMLGTMAIHIGNKPG